MSKHVGFYTKTKNGNVAHVLADKNASAETMQAIEKMIDIAYNKKGLGDHNKTQLNNMAELSYGQKAVGLTFNPSGIKDVNDAKQHCADVIDRLFAIRETVNSPEKKRLCSIAITEMQAA